MAGFSCAASGPPGSGLRLFLTGHSLVRRDVLVLVLLQCTWWRCAVASHQCCRLCATSDPAEQRAVLQGGSLAILAAHDLARLFPAAQTTLYTFGSPRVGGCGCCCGCGCGLSFGCRGCGCGCGRS